MSCKWSKKKNSAKKQTKERSNTSGVQLMALVADVTTLSTGTTGHVAQARSRVLAICCFRSSGYLGNRNRGNHICVPIFSVCCEDVLLRERRPISTHDDNVMVNLNPSDGGVLK